MIQDILMLYNISVNASAFIKGLYAIKKIFVLHAEMGKKDYRLLSFSLQKLTIFRIFGFDYMSF